MALGPSETNFVMVHGNRSGKLRDAFGTDFPACEGPSFCFSSVFGEAGPYLHSSQRSKIEFLMLAESNKSKCLILGEHFNAGIIVCSNCFVNWILRATSEDVSALWYDLIT